MPWSHPHALYNEEEDMFLHPYMADANCNRKYNLFSGLCNCMLSVEYFLMVSLTKPVARLEG